MPLSASPAAKCPGSTSAAGRATLWRLYSDNDLVRSTLGWEPAQQLDEIIATAWQWHSTHFEQ